MEAKLSAFLLGAKKEGAFTGERPLLPFLLHPTTAAGYSSHSLFSQLWRIEGCCGLPFGAQCGVMTSSPPNWPALWRTCRPRTVSMKEGFSESIHSKGKLRFTVGKDAHLFIFTPLHFSESPLGSSYSKQNSRIQYSLNSVSTKASSKRLTINAAAATQKPSIEGAIIQLQIWPIWHCGTRNVGSSHPPLPPPSNKHSPVLLELTFHCAFRSLL